MTITIDLSPAEEAQLFAAAKQEGMEPNAFLKKLVSEQLPTRTQTTFTAILAPVHEYTRNQGYTDEEVGAFVDSELSSYRAERRDRAKAGAGE